MGVAQGYAATLQSPTAPANLAGFQLPQPSSSGSLDLSDVKPVNSGTVSIDQAIAKARGIAAEKGLSYDGRNGEDSSKDIWKLSTESSRQSIGDEP